MNVITLKKEEWIALRPSLGFFSKEPEGRQEREFMWTLFHKINRLKSIRHTNMDEKWEAPFYRSIEYTVKYSQKGLLNKPYHLIEVLYHIHEDGMGTDLDYHWSLKEQHIIRFLNARLQALGLDYRYFDPYRNSHTK